ncbi:MAG TPA: response regulator [Allosphingosinicella sp.]|jgi:two-component system response regulator FixJ|nr:response regulator [Allosphingosinicella sp.]
MAPARTIVLVEDDDVVRRSTALLLRGAGHRVVEFARGEDLLAAALPEPPDAILLDLHLPGLTGIDVLRALPARGPMPPVVVLTGHGEVPVAVEVMKLGATEFLEKPCPPERLLDALERATAARPPARVEDYEAAQAQVDALTPRQREVLKGVALGQSNKLIAYTLGLSRRTVESYRAQLLAKLGVGSTAEAVRIALLAGLAPEA